MNWIVDSTLACVALYAAGFAIVFTGRLSLAVWVMCAGQALEGLGAVLGQPWPQCWFGTINFAIATGTLLTWYTAFRPRWRRLSWNEAWVNPTKELTDTIEEGGKDGDAGEAELQAHHGMAGAFTGDRRARRPARAEDSVCRPADGPENGPRENLRDTWLPLPGR